MIVKKKKEWNKNPNTWDGKFYIPCEIHKQKIKKILTSSTIRITNVRKMEDKKEKIKI
jgi:hypothetical protein